MPYYAVRNGRNPGVYTSWSDCKDQVDGYKNNSYKKFDTPQEARAFANGSGSRSSGYSGGSGYSSSGYSSGYSSSRSSSYGGGGGTSSGYSSSRSYKSSGSSRSYGGRRSGAVDVYTDGCCRGNNHHGDRRAGIGVYWGHGDSRNVSQRLQGRQTNQRAEIQAATTAVRQARDRGIPEINLHTDSRYLINSMTDWNRKWNQNGWISSTGEPVKNQDDLRELDSLTKYGGVQVNWKHVPAHRGIAANEKADRLANRGAMSDY